MTSISKAVLLVLRAYMVAVTGVVVYRIIAMTWLG